MLSRNLLLCSALALCAACSASNSTPSGVGSGVTAEGPSSGGDDDGATSGAEPQSPTATGASPSGASPQATTVGGVMTDANGQTTVVDKDGNTVVVTVVMNDDGTTSLVSDDGSVVLTAPPTDDILAGTPMGAPGCGDGVLSDYEACDDGNTAPDDGCASDCLTISPGFSCAMPGEPCRPIARCGDGLVAASEQCDDGNLEPGDGCSERCKIEVGKKCEGEPSVCSDAVCGDGVREGAEACDDGNTEPFDGCSALCLREPDCSGDSCTSECGDGLIINEECDDGNTIDGDGCSSDCHIESGFMCDQQAACETLDGACILRVPAIFRDFPASHPDFSQSDCAGTEVPVTGLAAGQLDPEGRPILGATKADACITSADTFAQWFRNDGNVVVTGDLLLFDNGKGGYVNRFGNRGDGLTADKFTAIVGGTTERQLNGTSCEAGCTQETRNSIQCDNVCRPEHEAVNQLNNNQLIQAQNALTQEENAQTPDPDVIAQLEDDLAAVEADIADAEAVATACDDDCQANFDAQVATCVDACLPCSYDNTLFCTGGELVEYDGNPLFFPVDGVTGATADMGPAKVPEQYGYVGWPWEEDVFGTAPDHNFSFTTEVQYWFRYEADTSAQLDFTGDDDVWVFVNNRIAVDLGGIHIPLDGSVTINAQSANQFGLEPGNVYKITVFQAERKPEGSSFRLTLSGFEAQPSDCHAVCGDGVLSFGEECDDGENDGGYGECAPGCVLGEFCGDGIVNGPEDCDNGPGGGEGCPNCRKLMAR
jgi:fibro-slime domain-containing protein